ncbi:enoyl-CoA hydratase/isomerase family protein [Nocardia altamirensis]|uniref:enoyl-CoA hydratase/isomerase family protein n=1 Tax=Nocardia altamirensis TaxID=472158 RepID=UPI00083FDFBE|nr:enoyl-CoA hydratase/isomerase family protein [Nocardia altamirensis]
MNLLEISRTGAVLTAALNNPPFNFLTSALLDELHELLDEVDKDPQVRAIVLTSAVPEAFVSHYDITEILEGTSRVGLAVGPRLTGIGLRFVRALNRGGAMRRLLDRTPAAGILALLRYHDLVARMRRSDKVFVAAIDGMALGGGCELALSCDIRLMADGPYTIGQPEILLDLMPGGGGTQILTRTIGAGRTLELALEGRPLTPTEAAEIGLIHRVVPPEALAAEAALTAARLSTRSPRSVKAIKDAVYRYGTGRLERGLAFERAQFLAMASQPGTKAALGEYARLVQLHEQDGGSVAEFSERYLPSLVAGEILHAAAQAVHTRGSQSANAIRSPRQLDKPVTDPGPGEAA